MHSQTRVNLVRQLKVGGGGGGVANCVSACISMHQLGGSRGYAPPGKFSKVDALRYLLRPCWTKKSTSLLVVHGHMQLSSDKGFKMQSY